MNYRIIKIGSKRIKISSQDFEWASSLHWYISHGGYAVSDKGGRKMRERIRMNRIVMQRTAGSQIATHLHVDHVNGDLLDNRRENLRITTAQQNGFNSKPSKGTSKYKGVSKHGVNHNWVGTIHINRKKIHIGCFDAEEEAALAYDAAALQLYGEYAWLNLIGRPQQKTAHEQLATHQ